MTKDLAIILIILLTFHVYSTQSTTIHEKSFPAWEELKQGSDSIDKLFSGSAVIGGATLTNALGLLKLQMYVKSVLSMDLDVSKTMHLPKIDNQIQKLAELVLEIKRDLDRKENSEVTMIKLNEAIDLVKIVFKMLKDNVNSARKDKRWACTEIVLEAAGIGALAGGGIMAVKGAAVVGTTAGAAVAGTTVVAVASAPVILTGVAIGTAGGAAVGGLYCMVRYFRYSNAIDSEAKQRRSELLVELVRIRSLAQQLKVIGGEPHEIRQFLKEVEELKVEMENFLNN